jgi:hypothetical protein
MPHLTRSKSVIAGAPIALALAAAGIAAPSALSAPPADETCVADMQTRQIACFGSEAEAETKERTVMPAGWTVHVKLYEQTGYSGKRIRLGNSAGDCTPKTSDVDGATPDLNFGPGQNWNNRARSFVTRNRCDAKLFGGRNFTGKRTRRYLDHSQNLANQGLAGKLSSYKIS